MRLMVVFDVDGMTAAQYDAVIAALVQAGQASPAGRISHAAAPRPGGWLVVDTYSSEESFESFGRHLLPVLASLGVGVAPRVYPAHAIAVERAGVTA